ncbi:hypothetical protein BOSEA31B_14683 [Hyphomicrobiales bacterium]|nr:hypothetical protein BOSEA31B_14683 [Hyphomicrobiales bacterium]CAH1701174.1 hypothetical protein BOSEA1005_20873 [Hyphomicrobiales bacterium]CAI0345139.1 hypothetical protein BO1005MUT1_370049 [Hyphomicrobiales bacterium]
MASSGTATAPTPDQAETTTQRQSPAIKKKWFGKGSGDRRQAGLVRGRTSADVVAREGQQ